MERFELSYSFDYVPEWTHVEAIREIFQNALDSETTDSKNKMYFNYSELNQTLKIGNRLSVLETGSLLTGCSSKRGDEKTIGKHGEGYKVATIVLLRENCTLKITNCLANQVWVAKQVESEKYKTLVPVFDIESVEGLKPFLKNNLMFEIGGITKDMFDAIVESNLHLTRRYKKGIGKFKTTPKGKILLDKKFAGKVYVDGLFICKSKAITMGYDFKPEMIKLDRDRGLIEDFNLVWSTSQAILGCDDIDFIESVVETEDAKYIVDNQHVSRSTYSVVADSVTTKFFETNGTNAVPCKTTEEFNEVTKSGNKAVLVKEQTHRYISSSSTYKSSGIKIPTLSENLSSWYDNIKDSLSDDLRNEGDIIIKKVLQVL